MTIEASKSREYQILAANPDDDSFPPPGNWRFKIKEPRFVGYWTDMNDPKRTGDFEDGFVMPHPRDAVDTSWDVTERLKVVDYLDAGHSHWEFFGFSFCRFGCKYPDDFENLGEMGGKDLTDGVWVYPEGYSHYLKVHNVKPPEDFIRHIRQNDYLPKLLDISEDCIHSKKHGRKIIKDQKMSLKNLKQKLESAEIY